MRRSALIICLAVLIPLLFSTSLHALQISQIEFDLHLSPGSSSSYSFLVINNEPRAQEITVYLNDWIRTPQGDTEFLPLNDARWLLLREFKAGERIDIVYRISPPFSGVTVSGSYATGSPTSHGKIGGPSDLSAPEGGTQSPAIDVPVRITRSIAPSPEVPGALRVRLTVEALQDFSGLRIDEVFSSHVAVESIDAAGGTFDTVARSNGDWITVSPKKFTIEEGKTQEVTFTVQVPSTGVNGTYWGAILIQGSPRKVEREGATVLAVERFGVKVYVTINGTEVLSGRVTSVRKVSLDPLTFTVTFENTGNVQLRPKGTIQIISQTGETVRTIPIEEFPVLPGAVQTVTVKDPSPEPLTPGIYRALVAIDYGGENLAGGTRDFRVK